MAAGRIPLGSALIMIGAITGLGYGIMACSSSLLAPFSLLTPIAHSFSLTIQHLYSNHSL